MRTAWKTDVGRLRTNNEDSILVDEELSIFLLADGLGGHNAGEVASSMAVNEAYSFLKDGIDREDDDAALFTLLSDALLAAHESITEKADADPELWGMGTTLVEMVIRRGKAFICHVGDSRAYLFRDRLKQITRDHTVGHYLLEQGAPREQIHPRQYHILTQSVGAGERPAPDRNSVTLEQGDLLLLCSDGLTDMLNDADIEHILGRGRTDPTMLVESLVNEANSRGGMDNISVVLAEQV
jgi:PPM family protein phosphatase